MNVPSAALGERRDGPGIFGDAIRKKAVLPGYKSLQV